MPHDGAGNHIPAVTPVPGLSNCDMMVARTCNCGSFRPGGESMLSRPLRQSWLLALGALASTLMGWLFYERIERERHRRLGFSTPSQPRVIHPPSPAPRPKSTAEAVQSPTPRPAVPAKPALPPAEKAIQPPDRPDDLTEIKGIGPAYAHALNKVGIHTFSDLAAQKPAELHKQIDGHVSLERVRAWVKQAKQLAAVASEESRS